jgi:Flp pilus assembly protein TadG
LKILSERDQKGAVAVEMAFVMPFLLLLFVGIVDFGMAYSASIGIEEAAQEGALYGAFHPSDGSGIRMRAAQSAAYPQLSINDVAVTCPSVGKIAITVTYDHDLITPIIDGWLGGTLPLQRVIEATVFSSESCVANP